MKNNQFNLRQFSRVGRVFTIDLVGDVKEMIEEVVEYNDQNELSVGLNPALKL